MDKVLSARVDEAILNRIGVLAQELHTTKKQVIESAIDLLAREVEKTHNIDILDHTFGAWHRRETADATVRKARKPFRDSMSRHQK